MAPVLTYGIQRNYFILNLKLFTCFKSTVAETEILHLVSHQYVGITVEDNACKGCAACQRGNTGNNLTSKRAAPAVCSRLGELG